MFASFLRPGQTYPCNGPHHPIGSRLVARAVISSWIDFHRQDQLTINDGHALSDFGPFSVATKAFIRAKYTCGQDGNSCSACNHSNAPLGLLKVPVVGSGAFGKQEERVSFAQESEYSLDGRDVAVCIPFDRDSVEIGDQFAEKTFKKRVSGEEMNGARKATDRDWRIVETGVIYSQDETTLSGHVLQSVDAQAMKDPKIKRGETASQPIQERFAARWDYNTPGFRQ